MIAEALRPETPYRAYKRNSEYRLRESSAAHSAFSTYRVIVHGYQSDWSLALRDRLDELTSLPVGWDGYNGRPVSCQTAHFVINMLERLCQDGVPAPHLVPGSDGSLQVEWHRNNYDVELDVLGPQNVVATRYNLLTDEEVILEIQNDFAEVVDWIRALSDANQVA